MWVDCVRVRVFAGAKLSHASSGNRSSTATCPRGRGAHCPPSALASSTPRRPAATPTYTASQLEKRNSSNDLQVLGARTNDLTDQCDFATPPNDALFSNANPASITPEAAQNAFVGHLVESRSTGPQGGGIVQVPGVGPVRVNSQQDLLAAGQQQQ